MGKSNKKYAIIRFIINFVSKFLYMDKLDIIRHPVGNELIELKKLFNRSLESSNPLLKSVLDYIAQRNGKMMRPILTLLVAKGFGTVPKATYHVGVTLEMLHTASLVHDDVVDESDERRGQLSVNAAFNNKISVLVGDYLLSTALQHSALTMRVEVVDIISQLGKDLSEGEILQLSNIDNKELSEGIYFDVIRKKTAVLFAACAQLGALTAGASETEAERFRLFGEKVGICFQIKDDIFDYFHDESIGKPTGNDMLEGKLTLPALYALQHTRDETMLALVPKIKSLTATTDEIARLIEFTKDNGGIEYAEEVMMRYKEDALLLLTEVRNEEVRRALVAYMEYAIEREK